MHQHWVQNKVKRDRQRWKMFFFRIFPKNDKTYSGGYLRKILPEYILKSSFRISLASPAPSSKVSIKCNSYLKNYD